MSTGVAPDGVLVLYVPHEAEVEARQRAAHLAERHQRLPDYPFEAIEGDLLLDCRSSRGHVTEGARWDV